MMRMNMVKHILNFKTGVGLELNNAIYYKQPVRYDGGPPPIPDPPRVILDNTPGRSYKKDQTRCRLPDSACYVECQLHAPQEKGFGFSGGISVGYLYAGRQKTVTSDEGKEKQKMILNCSAGNSLMWELSLGPVARFPMVHMARNNTHERGL